MKTYDRDIDYLGEIGRILRDLSGYSTLAYELIQNADDDGRATTLSFDVREDALVVQHDGQFSDCGEQDEPPDQCPSFLETGDRCDLHSFRRVGGANKAQRDQTTGAFGIGFTSVYQVTDRPELATAGHHWIIDETAPRAEGIQECTRDSCEFCATSRQATTLRLPWATDGASAFRRGTRTEPVPEDVCDRLTDELIAAVPSALLFLRRLTSVEVQAAAEPRCRAGRQSRDDSVTIRVDHGTDTTSESFVLLEGDFGAEANRLRERYPGLIEPARSPTVQVAIPRTRCTSTGRYFAYLPTEDRTELPAHVNGDFYPNSERKHLVTEGFRGEWNAAALDCAAQLLADSLPLIPEQVDVSTIWELLLSAFRLTKLAEGAAPDRYWSRLADSAGQAPILLTAGGDWKEPETSYYLQDAAEQVNAACLSSLGIAVASEEVAEKVRAGLKATDLSLRQLNSSHLGSGLRRLGLEDEVDPEDLPPPLKDGSCLSALLREVEILVSRERVEVLHDSALEGAAVLPCTDGRWRSVESVLPAMPEQLAFLESEGVIPVLDVAALPGGRKSELFRRCTPLEPNYLIRCLHLLEPERLEEMMRDGDRHRQLLLWLSRKREEIDETERTKLASLRIYPVAGGLAPIANLRLPDPDFHDELGLAGVIDLEGLEEARPLLEMIGAEPLDFDTYITWAVPNAVQEELHKSDPQTWSRLLKLLWRSASRIVDDPELVRALRNLPVTPTSEAGPPFVVASEAYFPTAWVQRCLGTKYPLVHVPDGHRDAATQLLSKLGVAAEPRAPHVLEVLDAIKAHPGNSKARDLVRHVLNWLGQRPGVHQRPPQLSPFEPLVERAWLPAEGDEARWYKPEQLYSAFAKPLVESVGPFLDVPLQDQRKISDLIDLLGVQNRPSTDAIINHLTNCARGGRPVSRLVYQELDNRSQNENDRLEIASLRDTPCLLIHENTYVPPSHVFTQENPFGPRRAVLGEGFQYARLLKAMRVKAAPNHEDALGLLREVATEYEPVGGSLSAADQAAVHAAWQILQRDLDGGIDPEQIRSALARRTCILLHDGRLATPGTVYIEDSPVVARAITPDRPFGLIAREESTWRAIRAAGVKNLSEDAEPVLLELSGAVSAPEMREHWRSLWPAIARVIDAARETAVAESSSRLDMLDVSRVEELAIQYRLRRYPDISNPAQRPGAALFDADSTPHLFISEAGHRHDLPRELARYLVDGAGLVGVVPTLATVLASKDLREAHDALDAYDVPRLGDAVETATDSTVVSDLAGLDDDWIDDWDETEAEGVGAPIGAGDGKPQMLDGPPSAVRGSDFGESAPDAPVDEPSGDTPEEGSTVGSTEIVRDSSQGSASEGATGEKVGRTTSKEARSSSTSSRSSGRLRSYVSHAAEPEERAGGDGDGRTEVDEAGVALVVDFEVMEGREPRVMPHHNKGFDILSRDPQSDEELTIEVKSVRGEWGLQGAAMSSAQFTQATTVGANYWLYIVEFATDAARSRLYRIQDPANRVEQFFFDDGWKAVAFAGQLAHAPMVELPILEPEPGTGRWPVFDLRTGLESPAGYLPLDEQVPEGHFIVQVCGRALADRHAPGSLVLIDPSVSSPEDGDAVLVELPVEDPDTGLALATRTWWQESGTITLGGGNGVAPLALEANPSVVGLIVREVS